MDLEHTCAALHSKNEQLRQENTNLKSMLSVIKDSRGLRARMHSFNGETLEDLTESKSFNEMQSTLNEGQFRSDMQQTKAKQELRSSSPINFRSFVHNSMHTDRLEKVELQSRQTEIPPDIRVPDRLYGEICYQLDRRILSFIFQGQKRLYGFTVLNIADKIIEVSTHPLTGKVDEGYRLFLAQRWAGLMDKLNQLGYIAALHPPFTEFMVNSYGILKERPGENSTQEVNYNDPEFLRRLIVTSAPAKLQRDLVLVLTCLCSMAEKDGKPLLLW